jgi:AraC-like DNA-binding protein
LLKAVLREFVLDLSLSTKISIEIVFDYNTNHIRRLCKKYDYSTQKNVEKSELNETRMVHKVLKESVEKNKKVPFLLNDRNFKIIPFYYLNEVQGLFLVGPYINKQEVKVKLIETNIQEFINNVLELKKNFHVKKPVHQVIRKMINDENFYRNRLKDYSNKTNYDEKYLGKEFQKKMSISFQDKRDILRVKLAKKELLFTNLTVKEISKQLGFLYASNFSNFFNKYTRTSPKQYRKNSQKIP